MAESWLERVGVRTSIVVLLLVAGCSPSSDAPASSGKDCIERYDASTDYFPVKVSPEFASNFSVEYHKAYKIVTVRRPTEGGIDKFVLLQCGAPSPSLPPELTSATTIAVPIKSLFSSSATQMQLLVDLGRVNALAGIGQARYVTTEAVLERIRRGELTEYATNDVMDTELIILKAPSVVMSSGGYSEGYASLRKAGIAVVENQDWQESSALARAEWLKFMALFFNEEEIANRQFDAIRDRYMRLKERTARIPKENRPRVMTGLVYRGMFEIAGGASYVARLISDAGGDYVWADNQAAGGTSVDLESQIARASDADVWINGGDWKSLGAMLSEEQRYKQFRAFQRGNVWSYNRLVTSSGGYDYWSRGITRPDLILGDLIKIFHPELAQDHEFVWYKQVPKE